MIAPRLLFVLDWYDGPIRGLAVWEDEVHWFEGDPYEGRWRLWRPDPETTRALLERKRGFEESVGTHWSFDVPVEERRQRDAESRERWYRDRPPDEDVRADGVLVGAFSDWASPWRRR